jgi:hypothetical protein
MFSTSEQAHFTLINKDSKTVTIYRNDSDSGGFSLTPASSYVIRNIEAIVGTVHSAVMTANEKYLVLVDEVNYYKLDVKLGVLEDPVL